MRGTFDEEVKARRDTLRKEELSKSHHRLSLTSFIEQRQLKAKKKIIDKFLKLREATEEMMSFRKLAPGGLDAEANSTLFVEGLSKRTSTALLNELFSQAVVSGFKEVRHIVEKEVAFVEYEDEHTASMAMQALQGYNIKESSGETTVLSISYAKR